MSPVVQAWCPNHWTTREFSQTLLITMNRADNSFKYLFTFHPLLSFFLVNTLYVAPSGFLNSAPFIYRVTSHLKTFFYGLSIILKTESQILTDLSFPLASSLVQDHLSTSHFSLGFRHPVFFTSPEYTMISLSGDLQKHLILPGMLFPLRYLSAL